MIYGRILINKLCLFVLGVSIFSVTSLSHAVVKDGELSGTILVKEEYCYTIFNRRYCFPISYMRELPVKMSVSNNIMTVSYGAPFENKNFGYYSTKIFANNSPINASVSVGYNSVTFGSKSATGFSDIDYHDVLVNSGIRFGTSSRRYTTLGTTKWRIQSLKCYLTPDNTDDTDKDGLLDCEEQPGVVVGSDPLDQSLALYDWGARVSQMDVFVEVDYMDDEAGRVDPYLKPRRDALQKVVDAYASNNVHVHFDVGDLLHQSAGLSPGDFDLGGGNMLPFSEPTNYAAALESRTANMDNTRADYFYYMLYASSQLVGAPGSSGWGNTGPGRPANTTLITLGRWTTFNPNVISNYQAGTMMHELGHNFGLQHGGFEDNNFKPNYISVMNYLYQFLGIPFNGAELNERYGFGWWDNREWPIGCQYGTVAGVTNGPTNPNMLIDYSDGLHASLDEATLSEQAGVDIADPVPMDFNCDGSTNSPNINGIDANHDLKISVLADHNDWNTDAWLMYFYMAKNPTINTLSTFSAARSATYEPLQEFTPPPEFFEALANIK